MAGGLLGAGFIVLAAALLPAGPAHAAESCNAWERGTLGSDGTWTAGAAGTDARTVCTTDTDEATLSFSSIPVNFPAGAARRIVHIADDNNARIDYLDFNGLTKGIDVVITGGTEADPLGGSAKHGIVVRFSDFASGNEGDTVRVVSNDAVSVSGDGGGGIYVRNDDQSHTGLLEAVNEGSITTTGNEYAHGVYVRSAATGGSAEARAVNNGTVKTTGTGSRAVYVDLRGDGADVGAGKATAINSGTITAEGNHYNDSNFGITTSDGLAARNRGTGSATATNESGATITVKGTGAKGISARTSNGGTALATNKGMVTSEGDTAVEGSSRVTAVGVRAESHNGLAKAVNESTGTIVSGDSSDSMVGERNRGLSAVNTGDTGSAEAVNRGMVTTYGDPLTGANSGSIGVEAWSRDNSSSAENSSGATIRTEGLNAHGLLAESERGEADESATAVNSGTITTTGSRRLVGSRAGSAGGIVAYTGAGAKAIARNSASGTVTVEGDGVRGLEVAASTYGDSTATGGAAEGVNHGSITTKGDAFYIVVGTDSDDWFSAHGMNVYSTGNDATATNETDATVSTSGEVAFGIRAWAQSSESGNASATNRGRIATTGASDSTLPGQIGFEIGSRGLMAQAAVGNATALNDVSGTITTGGGTDGGGNAIPGSGDRAFGILAQIHNDGAETSATAEARNRGTVVTKGVNADAVAAVALNGGTATNPNAVRAFNEAGASIDTAGAASGGLVGAIFVNEGGTDAYGSIFMRNDGTITTTGQGDATDRRDNAFGLGGLFLSSDGTTINNAGDVTLENTGTITVSGAKARGIQAITFGTGKATVTVNGGTVTASHDSDTDDSEDGTAVYASSGSGGIVANIEYGAVVKGPQAVLFENAPAALSLTRATLDGRVNFAGLADSFTVNSGIVYGAVAMGGGNDTLTVKNGGYFTGNLDLGAGDDTLTVNSGGNYFGGNIDFGDDDDTLTVKNGGYFKGNITNLETFSGGGNIRLANVTFSGSSAEFVNGSTVNLTGNFDLGATGTMTIASGARVNAFATGQGGATVLPTITAGGGITCGNAESCTFFLQNDSETEADATAEQIAGSLFGAGTTFADGTGQIDYKTDDGGTERILGSAAVKQDGTADTAAVSGTPGLASPGAVPTLPSVGPAPSPSSGRSGGSGGGAAAIGGGLLALLLALNMFDFDDKAEAAERPTLSIAQAMEGGTRVWARNLNGADGSDSSGVFGRTLSLTGSASGLEIGMESGLGGGFFLGAAAAPEAAASWARAGGGAAAAVSGGRYSLRGGWRNEAAFVVLGLTHADWKARTAFENPVADGGLRGAFDARQTDFRAGTGLRLPAGGGFRLTAAAEMFAGEVKRQAHRAEGAAFSAELPAVTQRYRGWKAGLGIASQRSETVRGFELRPALNVSAMQVFSESGSFAMKQSDRFGLIETSSRARLDDGLRTVFSFGTGLDAVSKDGLKLRLGYAALVDNGKVRHAVAAGLKLRF